MKTTVIYKCLVIFQVSLLLGGCDTFRNTLGLDHYSPNEWNTAEPHPGLILPPGFENRPELPLPRPGETNPHIIPQAVRAQKTVLGDDAPTDEAPLNTEGEKDIVNKASGDQKINSDIRSTVDREARENLQSETVPGSIIARIQSWKKEAANNLRLSGAEPPAYRDEIDDRERQPSPEPEPE